MLCKCGDVGQYKCPKCAMPYCSLSCYRVPSHQDCSEAFYREQVETELKERRSNRAEQEAMKEVLRRDAGYQEEEEEEEEAEEDILARLAAVELSTESELWESLSTEEQAAFLHSIKSGSISTLLEEKELWWDKATVISSVRDIAPFTELFTGTPSPLLIYSVLEVVLAYVTCELLYLDSDTLTEHSETLIALAPSLITTPPLGIEECCVQYSERSLTQGVSVSVPVLTALRHAHKLFTLGTLGVEKALAETRKIFSKSQKTKGADQLQCKKIKRKLSFLLSWNATHNSPQPSSLVNSLNTFILSTEKELESFEEERERVLKKGYSQSTQCTITEL